MAKFYAALTGELMDFIRSQHLFLLARRRLTGVLMFHQGFADLAHSRCATGRLS